MMELFHEASGERFKRKERREKKGRGDTLGTRSSHGIIKISS
jgi:hypothetical protein